ncbi:hypothetical protein FRC04_012218 [Tulasnella sp. 424]|nr:hypothetical protein FRC04_012218 [Tulasnella sp. 424]KAG8973704.1 hypothetical protein FRC05_008292 [Tulasnella sp. 425]
MRRTPIIFQARIDCSQPEFSVLLPVGYGTILPEQTVEVSIKRVAETAPAVRDGTYATVKFYWRVLLENELRSLSSANYQTLKQLWDVAGARAKAQGSANGIATVAISMFHTGIKQRPYTTWKDPREWTSFTYRRPGVENRAAFFKPQKSSPTTGGAFGSLWKCVMKFERDNTVYTMALKEIKLSGAVLQVPIDRKKILTRAEKELNIWRQLNHPNIGSVIGWLLEPTAQKARPIGDQRMDRWRLVKEITNGMYYLHSRNVVHGDLRHDQVLVDDYGHAKIVDFGLSKVIEEGVDIKITTSIRRMGVYEYMAPELLLQTPPRLKASDVYAFGLLILEVAVARVAFNGLTPGPAQVVRKIVQKTHLPGPANFKHVLLERSIFWDTFNQCTADLPKDRPPMSTVIRQLDAIQLPLDYIYRR